MHRSYRVAGPGRDFLLGSRQHRGLLIAQRAVEQKNIDSREVAVLV